ncbi:cytochrome P450 [Kitasatospora sp. NPDC048540]|uniref:cytochrome P450 n=1 Tax=Kitasatospora sp. NPDC048540 TaxID=3155634 RepID=UPI0033CFC695
MADPRISKNARHWRDRREGRIPDSWPLTAFFEAPSLLTADGAHHTRLRVPVQRAFTPARVRSLRPRIESIVDTLLDRIDTSASVDLKQAFSLPLPLTVICELLGVPEDPAMREHLHQLSMNVVDSAATPEQVQNTWQQFPRALQDLVEAKRSHPGDDLTSDLITAKDDGRLTDAEVTATLIVNILGGHETTVNLLNSAVRALLEHPDQLRHLHDGQATWRQAIAETLRWDPPIRLTMPRFTTADFHIDGTVIPEGALIVIPITTVGRCPHAHHALSLLRFDGHHRCGGQAARTVSYSAGVR